MSSLSLSAAQQEKFDSVMSFFLMSNRACFVFSGCAGSGKTSLIKLISDDLVHTCNMKVVVLTLTGRATSVLRERGVLLARTIHSFLYEPVINPTTKELIRFEKRDKDTIRLSCDAIIVDEASMITEEIFDDLIEIGVPILFVGDEDQLPPVSKSNFNVMEAQHIRLTEIHRQAADNPIIQLSKEIRERGRLSRRWDDGKHVRFINKGQITKKFLATEQPDIIVCGTNKLRRSMNELSRAAYGYVGMTPEVGERIMCLKNGVAPSGAQVFNGDIYTVTSIYHDSRQGVMKYYIGGAVVPVADNTWITESIPKDPTLFQFTYAYAATTYKVQGSQFKKVLFIDEDVSYFCEQRRYRYTSVTRASEEIIIAVE